MEVSVLAVSTEGEDSEGRRKWFVALPRLLPSALRPTAFGEALAATRLEARIAADRWTENLKTGKLPYTPTVLSWLSAKLDKPGRLITQADVDRLLK